MATAARVLDGTHGGRRLHQQPRRRAMLRVQRQADGDVDAQLVAVDDEGLAQRLAQAARGVLRLLAAAGQQQRKFVAGIAHGSDQRRRGLAQPRRHRLQQPVAGGVAVGLVDEAKMVDVEVGQHQLALVAVGLQGRVFQRQFEGRATGQPADHVEVDGLGRCRCRRNLAWPPGQQPAAGQYRGRRGRGDQYHPHRVPGGIHVSDIGRRATSLKVASVLRRNCSQMSPAATDGSRATTRPLMRTSSACGPGW
jgi:hypothetical protein